MLDSPEAQVMRDARDTAAERVGYLMAGVGGLLAVAAWLVQPLLVFAGPGREVEFPAFDHYLEHPWVGPLETAVFAGIGVGLLLLVTGVRAVLELRRTGQSAAARAGHALGVLAGCAWVVAAGWFAALFTSVGAALEEAAPDEAVQQAVLHMHNLGLVGLLVAAGIAFVGWLVMVATVGRAAAVVGRPLAILAVLAALVILASLATPFWPPWGIVGMQAFALVAGVAFVRKRP